MIDSETIARDVACYTTERERAAYRAGMSTAARLLTRWRAMSTRLARKRTASAGS